MITPKFTCTQDGDSVTISCYMPSIRASELEIDVDGTHFSLHVHPYFLRLTFPRVLIEDDDSYAKYEPSSAFLTVRLTKQEKGVHFEDLDLLSRLLAPSVLSSNSAGPGTSPGISENVSYSLQALTLGDQTSPNLATRREEPSGESYPLIEVLTSAGPQEEEEVESSRLERLKKEREIFLEAEKSGWRYPVAKEEEASPNITLSIKHCYGFLDAYSGYFKLASQTGNEVNELGDLAETVTPSVRTEMRHAHEEQKWDEEYYMADFIQDQEIQGLIDWRHPFDNPPQQIEFTESERNEMLKLPRKEYLPTPLQMTSLYLTLVTILFSYCYDLRTTQHEPTTESAWTIAILTPCMSALDVSKSSHPDDLPAVMARSYRRALSFPLYRNWLLCERLHKDVANILASGRRGVTRALLEVKRILEHSDVYYVYSKIWMEDYCVWVQTGASDEALTDIGRNVARFQISKSSIGWPLEELEEAVLEVQGGDGSEADSDDE